MSEGLIDNETQVGENSVEETPDWGGGPANAFNACDYPDSGTSQGNGRCREDGILSPDYRGVPAECWQQQPGEPSWAAERNNVTVDNTNNVNDDIPYGIPLIPQQVEGNQSDPSPSFVYSYGTPTSSRATDILMSVSVSTEFTKAVILDFVNSAMADLVTLSTKHFNPFDIRHFNQLRTARNFQRFPSSHLQMEASRETSYVPAHRRDLIERLMDTSRWAARFADIVSRSTLLSVISSSTEEYHGAQQVMTAEFHLPSPLVPVREGYFARYCKKVSSSTWGVVDVSLESLFLYPASIQYRRRPSGCLIKELANSCSKVTWVELVEVDNSMVPGIFQQAVSTGFAFGAQRWITAIIREHDMLLASRNMLPLPSEGVLPISSVGRASLLKLVEKMKREFFVNVSGSSTNMWMMLPVQGNEDIKITIKDKAHDFGLAGGRTFVLSTSAVIPNVPPKQVFDVVSAAKSRCKWDFLVQNYSVRELANIMVSPANRVSILEINNTASDYPDAMMLYLQRSYIDSTFAYVLHAPLDFPALSLLLSGGDPESVAFLTSGFTILPDRAIPLMRADSCGSLLSAMFHNLDDGPKDDHYNLSVNELNIAHSLVLGTVKLIKDNFTYHGHWHNNGRRGNYHG